MSDDELLPYLKEHLNYNPESGEMTWKVDVANGRIKAGSIAGHVSKQNGTIGVRLKDGMYLAHRLAWLLTYGKWPEGVVDHIDGNTSNNRINNLRDVSKTINGQNQRKPHSRSRTGLLGVCPHKQTGKFTAQIVINGEKKHLGLFATPEEGHNAYLAAKREHHEGCTI